MKSTFLLTGATGFIGSNIVRELVKQKQRVAVITRDKKLNWRLKDIASKLGVYEYDLLSNSLGNVVGKIRPDFIFHLASYGMPPNEDDVYKMVDVNLKGTINLVNAVKKNPFKLFINAGSCFEYGVKHESIKETEVLEPINDYAVIKSAISLYCQREAIRSGLPIITFRLFTPYGYREDKYRLIPSVILSAIQNDPIKVTIPTSVRDFIFIEDIVDIYLHVTSLSLKPGEIFNVGSGIQYSIGDVVNKVLSISKSKSEVLWGTIQKQSRLIEPKMWQADMSKTKKILNWEPKNTIDSGLQKTIQWFSQHQELYN